MAGRSITVLSRICRYIVSASLLIAAGSSVLYAQSTFQRVFGSNSYGETGRLRVVPVTGTCQTCNSSSGQQVTGGYISVGHSQYPYSAGNGADVYVVRTDNTGAKIWENTYDIDGANGEDVGNSIIELTDGSGFVVVGTTDMGTQNFDIFLMKLDCDGGVVWTRTYGGAGYEWGMDLIETKYGTPPSPHLQCAPGDIIVCGWTTSVNPNGNEDAYLMRVGPAGGNLLWGSAINVNGVNDSRFISLVEPTTYTIPGNPPTVLEDVVAVGNTQSAGTTGADAFAMRVNANTGTITNAAYHGGGIYGSCITINAGVDGCTETGMFCGGETFNSICEIPPPGGSPSDLCIAGFTTVFGHTTGFSAAEEIYLVRLSGGVPWVPAVQSQIGDGIDCSPNRDYAWTIRYIPSGINSNLTGHLAVVGATDKSTLNGDLDAFLLTVNPLTLQPGFGDIAKRYGKSTSSSDDEEAWSVSPVFSTGNIGFIIAGSTHSNPECLSPADPEDLYLVKTDANGQSSTDCTRNYDVISDFVTWSPASFGSVTPVTWIAIRQTSGDDRDWGAEGCSNCWAAKRSDSKLGSDEALPIPGDVVRQTVRSIPNPVKRGNPVTLHFSAELNEKLTITVVNELGELVYRAIEVGSGPETQVSVATEDLPTGVYMITIVGKSRQIVRIAVSQ